MSLTRHQNFVDGQFLANSTGEAFEVVNPGTGEIIYEVEVADDRVIRCSWTRAKRAWSW